MSGSIFALPVSVEQLAAAIKQMSQTDQKQLLDLVPDLRHIASQPSSRTVDQAQATVARLRAEVLSVLKDRPLSPDEPFIGGWTLGQYHALPDEERTKLWDEWAGTDLMELEEQEVDSNALPAG